MSYIQSIKSLATFGHSSLQSELTHTESELTRALIQAELHAFDIKAKILSLKSKLEYIKSQQVLIHPESRS